jgi:hypothetical protein
MEWFVEYARFLAILYYTKIRNGLNFAAGFSPLN